MKKIIMLVFIFMISIGSVFAENLFILQKTFLYTEKVYTVNIGEYYLDSYDNTGLNFTTYNGRRIGFYSSSTIFMPVRFYERYMGAAPTLADINDLNATYDFLSFGIDSLVGAGFRILSKHKLSFLAVAGLHNNFLYQNGSEYEYISYVLGPGAAFHTLISLTPGTKISFSSMLAFDLLDLVNVGRFEDLEGSGGVTWSLSAGIAFAY